MDRSQADHSVIARRAGARARASTNRPVRSGRPGTDLTARVATTVKPSGAGIRRSKARMTGAQRNSEGKRSEWNASPYYFTDPKWSQTVSDQR